MVIQAPNRAKLAGAMRAKLGTRVFVLNTIAPLTNVNRTTTHNKRIATTVAQTTNTDQNIASGTVIGRRVFLQGIVEIVSCSRFLGLG